MTMTSETTVVILAAGQGTRMKSRLAKVLHHAGGKPLIRHAIAAALRIAPAERVFAVVGHQAEAVGHEATAAGIGVILQGEQLGTGHALLCGQEKLAGLAGKLVITTGDCPLIRPETLQHLVDAQREDTAGALLTTDVADPTGYGRIVRNQDRSVAAIVEHKAATEEQRNIHEINAGFYCFDAAQFWKYIHEIRPDNPAREYYLTDMIAILLANGQRIVALKHPDSTELLGINNRVELAAADQILRARKVRDLMLEGVTIERPETVTIDGDVRVGMDSIIGPFAQLTGETVVGENCRIGAGSIIQSSHLGDGVEVFPFSMISESRLESHAHVGPFARIRMGAHVEEGAHIGNFVELKKTRMGAGAKSMHLAYLGDATIGAKSNIGAGTITCNYDGTHKHPTQIGHGVFVGSNSTLVAPVEIAEGAYIAAGSVITENVPKQALALGRARQVNKEGWKKKPPKA
jgi:bifunctional UDP-N-acetylglucosamine pyrophosphorylase/glucosamine-1-phosphate N-acetyltransferase